MEVRLTKSRLLLSVALISALLTSTNNVNAISFSTWLKVGAASFAGFVGLKMLTPAPKPVVYYNPKSIVQKPTFMSTIDSGLGITIKTGVLLGGIYLFDRYFLNGTIVRRIEAAKDELKDHISTRIEALRNYLTVQVNDFRDDVDDQFTTIENRLDKVDRTIIKSTDKIIKKIDKKKK